MTQYRYTGRGARRELVSGMLDDESAEAVAVRLADGGVTPIAIAACASVGTSSPGLQAFARRLGLGRPNTADLVLFTRQMFTIVKSGLPLLRGLRGLAGSTHNAVLREALEDVLRSLEGGRNLTTSLARHPQIFPQLYLSLIAVGEATGTLEAAFERLGEYLRQERDIQDRVKSAMRYPMIVLVAIAAAVAILTTLVIPRFAPLFQTLGNDIPLPTRIIMGASRIARDDWPWLIGGLVVLLAAVRSYVRTPGGRYRWHEWLLKLPVFGPLAHQAALARLGRTLSISIAAGLPMLDTLGIVAQVCGNEYLARRMLRLRESVEHGAPLSRAAAEAGIFSPLVLQMLAVGEETGELPQLLDEIAGYYEREVDFALKTLTAAIEPLMIVLIGGMVLILALGVFLPMWNMIARVAAGH